VLNLPEQFWADLNFIAAKLLQISNNTEQNFLKEGQGLFLIEKRKRLKKIALAYIMK
jgi:hypothetical protein